MNARSARRMKVVTSKRRAESESDGKFEVSSAFEGFRFTWLHDSSMGVLFLTSMTE